MGWGTAAGFAIAIVVLGGLRELLGSGTLFAGTDELLGGLGSKPGIELLPATWRLPVVQTPPGAFLVAGVALAAGQALAARATRHN